MWLAAVDEHQLVLELSVTDSCCVRVLISDHLCVFVKYIYSCTTLFCLVDPGVVTLVSYFTHEQILTCS